MLRHAFLAFILIAFLAPPANGANQPQRIVSLAPAITETLFLLGAGNCVVGVTDYDTFPEVVRELPSVGGYSNPSIERILSIKPDLVVGIKTFHRELLDRLSEMGIKTLELTMHRRLYNVKESILALGKAVGKEEAAEALWGKITSGLENLKEEVARRYRDGAPSILVVVWHEPLIVAGGYSYLDDVMRAIGLPNAAGSIRYTFPQMSREKLLALNPKIVILAKAERGMSPDRDAVERLLSDLPLDILGMAEVKNDAILHPGPRALEAARVLVEAVAEVSENAP
jgi:iron complex transport system substrate-binding protein